MLFGQAEREQSDGSLIFPTGEIELRVLTPAAARSQLGLSRLPDSQPAYLGYEIEVESLDRLRAHLSANDVPFQTFNQAVLVAPEVAFGNLIRFREGSSS